MKKIIIATIALLGVVTVQAQRNSVFLETDLGYHRVDDVNNNKENKYSFNPIIAYEFADNWYIGAKTGLTFADNKVSTDQDKIKTKEYEERIGGFIRYYQPFNETFGMYGDLGAGYQQARTNVKRTIYATSTTEDLNAFRTRTYGYYIDFTPVFFINFKNNFGLNISFGSLEYKDTKTNTASNYNAYKKEKNFDLTFGDAIKIGVSKKFSF